MYSFEGDADYPPPLNDDAPEPYGPRSLCREIVSAILLLAIGGWIFYAYYSNDYVPVTTYRLGSLLPKAPNGWKQSLIEGDNPSSVQMNWSRKDLSSVSRRTYRQSGKEITVELWDWAGSYPYHMPFDIPGWMNGDEVRVGAETGRLRYNPESRKGRLRVRYLDRFYIVVEGEGIERHELDTWYNRVDLAGLRRELAELRGGSSSR